MPRRQVWLALPLALALFAAPALAKSGHKNKESEIKEDHEGETTKSLGSKWPITKGILGCVDYDSDAGECTECLEPYFTLEDGVCECSSGYGLAPFAYGDHAGHKAKLMVCAPCPTGTWSDGGAYSTTLCERCPTGSTTAGPTSESKDDCNICQSGFAGDPDAGEPCKLCPAGTYADPDDNAECTPCPEDDDGNPTTTPKAGAVEEDQCYIAVCDEGYQSVKGKCYECAEGWTSDKGNANFGKYQPKCYKEGKKPDYKSVHVKKGGLWHEADGHLAEPKEHDKEPKIPDYSGAHAPKWAGKEDKHHDDDDGKDDDGKDDDGHGGHGGKH